MLLKVELAEFDATLGFLGPVFGFLLTLEGVANGGVPFYANDGSPAELFSVFVFSLEN